MRGARRALVGVGTARLPAASLRSGVTRRFVPRKRLLHLREGRTNADDAVRVVNARVCHAIVASILVELQRIVSRVHR